MTEPVHPGDPFAIFAAAFARAVANEPFEANAMTLATVGATGAPSARVVLLKGADARGFVFYTNYDSRKGRELDARPVAALMLHWKRAEEQVRVEGDVERVSAEESDAYFRTRPRESQIGAWASLQSETLGSRAALAARFEELSRRPPPRTPRVRTRARGRAVPPPAPVPLRRHDVVTWGRSSWIAADPVSPGKTPQKIGGASLAHTLLRARPT